MLKCHELKSPKGNHYFSSQQKTKCNRFPGKINDTISVVESYKVSDKASTSLGKYSASDLQAIKV